MNDKQAKTVLAALGGLCEHCGGPEHDVQRDMAAFVRCRMQLADRKTARSPRTDVWAGEATLD